VVKSRTWIENQRDIKKKNAAQESTMTVTPEKRGKSVEGKRPKAEGEKL